MVHWRVAIRDRLGVLHIGPGWMLIQVTVRGNQAGRGVRPGGKRLMGMAVTGLLIGFAATVRCTMRCQDRGHHTRACQTSSGGWMIFAIPGIGVCG